MSSKEKKKGALPKLRFPEFRNAGEWEVKKIGELLTLEYGASLPEEARQNGSIPVVGSNGVVGFHSEAIVSGPAIVVGRKGSVGEINWIDSDCYPIDTTFYVKLKYQNCLLIFIKLLLENANLTRLSDNGTVPGLNRNDVYVLKSALPSLPEQQKIADCLSSLDEVIELETKKLEALKAHKKGLMQQLFPREGETTPRLRFSEFRDAGEWEVKRLGEVFQERNERNGSGLELLSVTLSDGVVKSSQLKRKNNSSCDLCNYKKVYPNDIVYNSMRMWQGASGLSKWYGIVSPAYTVIKLLERQVPVFWKYYLKHPISIEKFKSYSQGVTSDTWNLKFPAFSKIKRVNPIFR